MSDDIRRQALARSLAARHAALGLDELRVIDELTCRLELGRQRYGELDLAKPRDWDRERFEERIDALVYDVCGELAEQDRRRGELQEQAQAEMAFGDRHPKTVALLREVSEQSTPAGRMMLVEQLAREGGITPAEARSLLDEPAVDGPWDARDVGGEA
jgi:hypothetical protein